MNCLRLACLVFMITTLFIKENEGWMPFVVRLIKNEYWFEQPGPNVMRTLAKNSMKSQWREKPAKVLKFPSNNIKRRIRPPSTDVNDDWL